MSTRVLLIRHASVDPIGSRLAGRDRGVHLNENGRIQAQQLVNRLAEIPLDAIYSSPLARAQETAGPLAAAKDLKVAIREEFTEIDFGEWSGKTFAELDRIPEWIRFNRCRSLGRIPGGESILEVTSRMIAGIESLCQRHPAGVVAIFSHCDPIRAALVHFAGMNLDGMLRLSVAPASISAVDVDPCGPRILALNHICGGFQVAEA